MTVCCLARRAKRRATRNEPEQDGTASSEEMHSTHQHKDDIEARLATVEDEKEAKRLKRWETLAVSS